MKPGFFIVGERKCGTSSLYRYICDHPQVLPCKVKEPQFFSRSLLYRIFNYGNYARLFPLKEGDDPVEMDWWILDAEDKLCLTKVAYSRNRTAPEITGEASANTFAIVPPERLHRYYPDAHVIVCMRNPTERAFSHYRMFERFAEEGRKLPFALTNFHDDAKREINAFHSGNRTYFIGLGVYVERFDLWKKTFGERLLVVFTEHLKDPVKQAIVMNEIVERFALEPHDFGDVLKTTYNTAKSVELPENSKSMLDEFYAPFNQRLAQTLNRELPWS